MMIATVKLYTYGFIIVIFMIIKIKIKMFFSPLSFYIYNIIKKINILMIYWMIKESYCSVFWYKKVKNSLNF